MTPAVIGSIITFVAQLFIAAMLTLMILEMRRIDREIKHLTRWLIHLDSSIPMKGRIAPGQAASSTGQPSDGGPQGSGGIHTGDPRDPTRWN